MMIYDQSEFDVRCEWGEQGVKQLAPISDAIIIVDVLSFSTCVSIATAQGALVYPYARRDVPAIEFARSMSAELAGHRDTSRYSLSPASLTKLPASLRLVLPSPNGSTLSLATGHTPTFAGCLRNAKAVAQAALKCGSKVAVIPAGERWSEDNSLRPAIEDWIGAGAIMQHLPGNHSPEARLAIEAFRSVSPDLEAAILQCSSGKELEARGFAQDIILATELDADACAARLRDGCYQKTASIS